MACHSSIARLSATSQVVPAIAILTSVVLNAGRKWRDMGDLIFIHRLHLGFTIAFHYLFPQLTMGLALLIATLETGAVLRHSEALHRSARFWARTFAVSFVLGAVKGIPIEFQFGTQLGLARVFGHQFTSSDDRQGAR